MSPTDLVLPRGFQLGLGCRVACQECGQQWHVPEGQHERLSDAAVKLLRTHRREQHPRQRPPPGRRVEAYCPMCREERQIKVPEGKHWGQCAVCGSSVGTSY